MSRADKIEAVPVKVRPVKERPKPPIRKAKPITEQRWYWLAKLFMLPRSEKITGRDKKEYEIFYRYGPSGGAYTIDDLWKLGGYDKKLAAWDREAIKDYGNTPAYAENRRHIKSKLMGQLNGDIAAFKRRLESECRKVGLIPLFESVRIHSAHEETRRYIQGYVNPNSPGEKFVIGSRDDCSLWAMKECDRNRKRAEIYRMAISLGDEMLKHQRLLPAWIRDGLLLEMQKAKSSAT